MKNFKWPLIAGGIAYVLFREQIAAFITAHTSTAQPAAGANTGTNGQGATSTGTTTTPTTTPAPTGVWPQVQALGAQQGQTLSPDQWLFIYRVFRGSDNTTPEQLGLTHDRLYTFDEFKAAMSAKGLSAAAGPGALPAQATAASFARRAWGINQRFARPTLN